MKIFTELTKDFDYVNSDIERNFPLEKPRSAEYKLFHFNETISSEVAIERIEKEGYLPATLSELLSWPDWNQKDDVIALGSVAKVDGYRHVPALWRSRSGRRLDLRWFDGGWREDFRFLAVRKVSDTRTSEEVGHLDSLSLEARIAELEEWRKNITKVFTKFGV